LPGNPALASLANADDLKGRVRESRKEPLGEAPDGFPGEFLARDGVTVGTPFSEERDDRIGIVTVPGVAITFYVCV
jgi:hypothetical protein